MQRTTQRLITTMCGIFLIALPFAAQSMGGAGQSQQGMEGSQGMQQPGAAGKPSLDDQTIKQFAKAFSDVMVIQQNYSKKLENAGSNQQSQELQQEAQRKMVDAVQENGLSVPRYNEVVAMMERNPQLRDRILQEVN